MLSVVYTASNLLTSDGSNHGQIIKNITPEKLWTYAAGQPFLLAVGDADNAETLGEVLVNQFHKLEVVNRWRKKPGAKRSDRIQKHIEDDITIDNITHKLTIESSITTDTAISYLTNIRLTRIPTIRNIHSPADQVFAGITLAIENDGSISLHEKLSIEIYPTGPYPASLLEDLIDEPLFRLIDSPLGRSPAMTSIRIARVESIGPIGVPKDQEYMIIAMLTRPPGEPA